MLATYLLATINFNKNIEKWYLQQLFYFYPIGLISFAHFLSLQRFHMLLLSGINKFPVDTNKDSKMFRFIVRNLFHIKLCIKRKIKREDVRIHLNLS